MMTRVTILFVAILSVLSVDFALTAVIPADEGNVVIRWCTDSAAAQKKCKALREAIEDHEEDDHDDDHKVEHHHLVIECHKRETSGACLWEVGQGSLDVTSVRFRDSYFSGKSYGLIPLVAESYTTGSNVQQAFYKAVAVLRKGSTHITDLKDLKGLRSCHTVVYRNAGWAIPMSLLIERGLLTGNDCLDNVENVANFFLEGCAATSQRPSYNYLGANVSNLCNLCNGVGEKKCSLEDPYAGYEGAFQCLLDGRGEIAFVKNGLVQEVTKGNTYVGQRQEDFELLCPDGSRRPVDKEDECNWGLVPPRAIMASPHLNQDARHKFKSYFLDLEHHIPDFKVFESSKYGAKNLLFSDDTKKLYDPRGDYKELTGPTYVRTLENQTLQCPSAVPSTVRWCVVSTHEIAKCHQMALAFEFWFVKPRVQCVVGDSLKGCMAKIRDGSADLITLDGGQIYTGGKDYNLKPILFEDYGKNNSKYWAVAVVKKKDQSISFTNLKGKNSCHTGVGRTAGWDVPIATLIKSGQITVSSKGNLLEDVSDFFSKSCAPGAATSGRKPSDTNLCALCKGRGDNLCSLSSSEPYFGYSGAFRCLVEGGGDVAFVNHLTAGENTDGNNKDDWAENLKSSDYELLCPDGQRKPIDQYETCSLAKVPAHAVVTSSTKTTAEINAFIHALEKGQEFYRDDTNPAFRMFASGPGSKDILFRDATTRLVRIPVDSRDYKVYLGDFLATAEFLDSDYANY